MTNATLIAPGPAPSLAPTFTVSVDQVTETEWNELLPQFADTSVYQTWAYGKICWGEKQLSHLVLRRNGSVAAIAQVRLVCLPIIKKGIAYLRWGPLWRRWDSQDDPAVLSAVLSAIKKEYAHRRKLVLRFVSNIFPGELTTALFESSCAEAGFVEATGLPTYRTIRLDLSPPLEALRKGLDQKWRNQLNGAERNGLRVVEGNTDELFARFLEIYQQMMARKQFETSVDIQEFRSIQHALPSNLKMPVLLCEKDGQTLAGVIISSLGESGIYLLGATSDEGMKSKGSYLLQWRAVQLLKERGCRWYDLGGINPERNPGVYHFKSGLGGQDTEQCGRVELSGGALSSLCISSAESIKKMAARFKNRKQL